MGLRLPGGALEYAVLSCLWKLQSASARAVYEEVGAPQRLVYTTVTKVLDRLHAKRLVSREKRGKAFLYAPAVERREIERARATSALSSLLGDDPRPAVVGLVDAVESLDPDLLDELARAVNARRRSRRGP